MTVLLVAPLASNSKAAPLAYSSGDVFIGFQSVSLNKDLLFDIGQGSSISSFISLAANVDLINAFGSGWYSVSDLQWGVFGMPTAKTTVWASVASGGNAWGTKSTGALTTSYAHFSTMGNEYNTDISNGQVATGGNGVYMNVGTSPDTGFNTWTGNAPSTAPFSAYSGSIENGVAGTLDVYATTSSASTAIFKAANGNALQVTANGTISVVPEPSTYALMGLGLVALVIAYRRKAQA